MGFMVIALILGILTFLIEGDMRKINRKFKAMDIKLKDFEDKLKVLEDYRIEQEHRKFIRI